MGWSPFCHPVILTQAAPLLPAHLPRVGAGEQEQNRWLGWRPLFSRSQSWARGLGSHWGRAGDGEGLVRLVSVSVG